MTAVSQSLQQSWGAASGGCTVTFNFTCSDNATSAALSGCTVYLYGSGGSLLTSGATAGSGQVTLVAGSDSSYKWVAQAASTYIDYSGTISGHSCDDVVNVSIRLDANTFCPNRLSQFMTLTESYYGLSGVNCTYILGRGWQGQHDVSYLAGQGSTCINAGTVGLTFLLKANGTAFLEWTLPISYTPGAALCPKIPSSGSLGSPSATCNYDDTTGTSTFCTHPAVITRTAAPNSAGSTTTGGAQVNAGKYIFPSLAGSTAVCSTVTWTEA